MKTTKLLFYFLSIVLCSSCSSSDDSSNQLPSKSYYKITVDGVLYESDQLTSTLGTYTDVTDEFTGVNVHATLLQVNDDDGEVFLTIQANQIDGNVQPLSNDQETYDSFILIAVNDTAYYSDSGTITIVEDNPYQSGLTETLMTFSGIFVNSNDENDVKNISGEAYAKKIY